MEGGSPFRLLQDYASDDSSEKDIKNLSSGTESQSRTIEKVFSEPSDGSLSNKAVGLDPTRRDEESGTTFITSGGTNRRIHNNNEDDTLISPAETFQKKDDLRGGGVDDISENDKVQKGNEEENASSARVPYKVDEFGRYLRQGASDSDSDDSRYGKRRKRGRSYSRSRSPADRRRSPWKRRREKRSHSRSWSPRSRRSMRRRNKSRSRSRSRSPTFRQFSGANKRWGKGQSQVCFDFLRGKCNRGTSCRYLHNDSDNSDRSRQLGNKQNLQVSPPGSKIQKVSVQDNEKVDRQEKEHHHDMQNDGNFLHTKEDCSRDTLHSCQKAQSPNSTASGVAAEVRMIQEEPEELNSQEAVESHQPDSFPSQSVSDVDAPKSLDDTYLDVPALDSAIKPPVTEPSSIAVCSSQPYLSSTSMSQHHLSGQSLTCKESSPLRSAAEIQHHHSHLQLPPPPPLVQGGNTPHMPLTSSMPLQYPSQSHLLPPPPPQLSQAGNISHMRHTSFIPSQSAPRECFRPYMFPYQQSNFTVPPTSSWNSLPLPPPPPPPRPPHDAIVSSGIATSGAASQPQQSNLPPRNDSDPFLRSHPTQLPIRSLVNEFQHQAYPPMQEHYHALSRAGDFRLSTLPAVNPLSHAQRPVQYSSVNNSFPMGMHLQPRTDLRELPATKVQPLTGDNLPPSELLESSSQVLPYSQQQQLHPSTDSFLVLPNKISSSRYPPIPPDVNKPSHLPDFGGSRIPTYYNPYASTFEQPLSSKLSSNDFRQENSSGLSNPSLNQQGLDSFQSTKTSSLPTSARATGHVFPIEGKDQYDPLFDCIEPSSSSYKKSDHFQTTDDSNTLRLSGSNMPLGVGGNNKKEVGTVDITMLVDNDECGETGDAEVGVVENESPSDPIDSTDMNAGEVEIDQVKSSGKSKKSKDSRSMRVFKVALADFVKEILKPSWRQGNMSKEAFKTIVKKTVEKVSKAMKKHQIPKSKPKIDQYIDSSQRKLTKLVMGYVDKYVKG